MTQHNPSLAISNILGSCTANILGSFSLGLIFARSDSLLSISDQDKSSSRIYSWLLVIVGAFVILFGPGWGMLLKAFKRGGAEASAGRWAGIFLLIAFALYVGGIVYGIQRGTIIAPEDSDSDSDSDSDTSDDATCDEDETLTESNERPATSLPTSQASVRE